MIGFSKIAGYEKEKQYLSSIREMMIHPDRYIRAGVRIPHGILLFGDPGVGKSVLARAIAEEPLACVELCSADCARDNAADYVVKAFESARKQAPAVLLIDELDKISESSYSYYNSDNDRLMKILLEQLDLQKEDSRVLVVGTCNDYSNINSALLRSGRVDRMIQIGLPLPEDRKAIIRFYLSKLKIEQSVDLNYLAKITAGYTGAQIECFLNEAGFLAVEDKANVLTHAHVLSAMNNIAFRTLEGGPGSEKRRRVISVHEAGHALAAHFLTPNKLTSASVISRGRTFGHIRLRGSEEDEIRSMQEIEDEVTVTLAGAAAEQFVFTAKSVSADDDFSKAVHVVEHLITRTGAYGLDLIFPTAPSVTDRFPVSEKTKEKVDQIRAEVLDRLFARAKDLLIEHKEAFFTLVDALYEKYTLSGEDVSDICRKVTVGEMINETETKIKQKKGA